MAQGGYSRRGFLKGSGITVAGLGGVGLTTGTAGAGEIESHSNNPWWDRRVLNIAHRGGTIEAPENTLFALQRAFAQGAHIVEFDIRETKDGELVVHHDETVDRRTNGSGKITEHTLEELKALDAAYWFVPGSGTCHPTEDPDHSNDGSCPEGTDEIYEYRGYATGDRQIPPGLAKRHGLEELSPNDFTIPTVREVLEAFPDEYLMPEIKQDGIEAQLANLLEEFDRGTDTLVLSIDHGPISEFREIKPEIPTCASKWETAAFILWSWGNLPTPPDLWFEMLPLPLEYQGIDVFSSGVVDDAHAANIVTHPWTINERDNLERVISAGADGALTDRPTLFGDMLAETGKEYDGEPVEDDDRGEGGGGPGFTLPAVGLAAGLAALLQRKRKD